jgi:hypothetical protein
MPSFQAIAGIDGPCEVANHRVPSLVSRALGAGDISTGEFPNGTSEENYFGISTCWWRRRQQALAPSAARLTARPPRQTLRTHLLGSKAIE